MTYTVGQAAKRMGVTVPTLRYYDKEGLLPFLGRKQNGTRVFREEDFGWLDIINCMKNSGLAIKDIRKYIDLCMAGDETLEERLQIFLQRKQDVLQQLRVLEDTIKTIDHKIDYYKTAIKAGTEAIHKK